MDALGVPNRVADAVVAFLTLLVVTSVSMIFGELVPKNLAVARPMHTARAVAGPQLLFSWLMTYPIRLTNGVANWILRKLGVEPLQELRRPVQPRSWCRWCATPLAAARWIRPPRHCWTARCNSAT